MSLSEENASFAVKAGLAQMLKVRSLPKKAEWAAEETNDKRNAWTPQLNTCVQGGVIMDVVTPEQARIAEEAGAVAGLAWSRKWEGAPPTRCTELTATCDSSILAVMALERVPADIRKDGGVARMSDPSMIKQIKETVTIPVMAKARIGHFVEAQILEAIGCDYIDESEVLTPADEIHHINKHKFKVPFVCGCRNLGEALRRVAEGAAMIRTKGEAGTGDVVEAVRHARAVVGAIRHLETMDDDELYCFAKVWERRYMCAPSMTGGFWTALLSIS